MRTTSRNSICSSPNCAMVRPAKQYGQARLQLVVRTMFATLRSRSGGGPPLRDGRVGDPVEARAPGRALRRARGGIEEEALAERKWRQVQHGRISRKTRLSIEASHAHACEARSVSSGSPSLPKKVPRAAHRRASEILPSLST